MQETGERPGGIQVIARAAAILRLLGDNPGGLSLAGIALHIGLARSTVQRIVQALEAEGFVELSGPAGGFRLGPSLARLVFRRQREIVTEVGPFLEALRNELSETVALCTLSGASVTVLDHWVAEEALRVVFPLGTIPHPAHRLAPGRAILSALPFDRAMKALMEEMPEADARRELADIAKDKDVARDTGTFIADISGFAVPARTQLGLYAIAVVLPTSRVRGRVREISSTLRSAAAGIERKIGQDDGRG